MVGEQSTQIELTVANTVTSFLITPEMENYRNGKIG